MFVTRVRNTVKELFGLVSAGSQRLTVHDDDLFITSYPRSGNTWCRMIVATLLLERAVSLSEMEALVPDIYRVPDARLRHMRRPRKLKSHEPYDPRYQKVLYVVRRFPSVLVSAKWYLVKMNGLDPSTTYGEVFEDIQAGRFFPRFGPWNRHVLSWLTTREGSSGFHLVRYEDLMADPVSTIQEIADFVGHPVSRRTASQVSELCRFERLQKTESGRDSPWWVSRKGRDDIPFFRSADPEEWRSELSSETVERIWRLYGDTLGRLGYQPPT